MFFPIGDDDTARRTVPLVTYALIALNVLFFFVELSGGDAFIMKWAFVPSRFLAKPFNDFLTLFTSMFMHAGWVHLGGNMLYLWIFGDNVEDRFGPIKFTIFYLLCGGLRQLLCSWRLASDQACRIWEHRGRLRGCSALTFCCSHRERSEYCRANK